ncbi:transglycosylase SLT domain-containing protein [Candidatus Nitronereus thalassa]|uniref:Transglycosylase SLT domain-containing protein n=1 Tax=Candidatus Nitronereus thalassa TaxID=3020898 RepID=A0ABU3K4E3_9BACT|nr:transglycosylase SLT domain-containing protein [Candidatus Nitronereus thalassa]MDT7041284.1 transglycosylase SLT domain-containing protein [Candidatus Nitronereus thalassa]
MTQGITTLWRKQYWVHPLESTPCATTKIHENIHLRQHQATDTSQRVGVALMFTKFSYAKSIFSSPTMDTYKIVVRNLAACTVLVAPLLLFLGSTQWQDPTSAAKKSSLIPKPPSDLPWYDIQRFQYHVQTRLPLYREQFEQAAKQYGVPWTLLAAQAYQESRWDRHAKSPTGVRGLMMLTRNTASSLGIKNRLDPDKSIDGGARYVAYLKKQINQNISKQDRTWFALAAYNVGLGHVRDAQKLAVKLEKNPHSWKELKTVLPLLSNKTYYQNLQYGYARGREPVQYVKRIRAYHALLEHYLREI